MKKIFKILILVTLTLIASCGKDKETVADNREAVNVKANTPTFY